MFFIGNKKENKFKKRKEELWGIDLDDASFFTKEIICFFKNVGDLLFQDDESMDEKWKLLVDVCVHQRCDMASNLYAVMLIITLAKYNAPVEEIAKVLDYLNEDERGQVLLMLDGFIDKNLYDTLSSGKPISSFGKNIKRNKFSESDKNICLLLTKQTATFFLDVGNILFQDNERDFRYWHDFVLYYYYQKEYFGTNIYALLIIKTLVKHNAPVEDIVRVLDSLYDIEKEAVLCMFKEYHLLDDDLIKEIKELDRYHSNEGYFKI